LKIKKRNILTSSGSVSGKKDWTLSRYNEKSLSKKIGTVPEILKANEGMIFGILEANDGSIWFGTLDGVYRYDGNSITDFRLSGVWNNLIKNLTARNNC